MKKYKILIVDDEIEICSVLKFYFIKNGFDVKISNSGREAIDIVKSDDTIDLIILDVKMPEIKGIEVFKTVRELGINKPILFLTGSITMGKYFDELRHFGFVDGDFLPKPVDLNVILQKIKEKLRILDA